MPGSGGRPPHQDFRAISFIPLDMDMTETHPEKRLIGYARVSTLIGHVRIWAGGTQ